MNPNRQIENTNHELSEDRCLELEAGLAAQVKEQSGPESVTAVWIPADSQYANLIRTLEAKYYFPEIPDLMVGYEAFSRFLAMVDTRQGKDKVVHAFRITSKKFGTEAGYISPGGTGIALIDDLLTSGQGLDEAAFYDYYHPRNVDIDGSIGVETNFRIIKTAAERSVPVPILGYISLFNLMRERLKHSPEVAIFTHVNRVASVSLMGAGVEFEQVAGMESLRTPTVGGKFDDRYRPVAIPSSSHNIANFEALRDLGSPELEL
jgi:hypothetical protein